MKKQPKTKCRKKIWFVEGIRIESEKNNQEVVVIKNKDDCEKYFSKPNETIEDWTKRTSMNQPIETIEMDTKEDHIKKLTRMGFTKNQIKKVIGDLYE